MMKVFTNTDEWAQANQQYLAGKLKQVRQQLDRYNAKPDVNQEEQVADPYPTTPEQIIGTEQPPAIERLVSALQLSPFEKDVLLLCAGMELDPGIADAVFLIQGQLSNAQPSFGLALASLANPHWTAVIPAGPLRYWRLIEMTKAPQVMRSSLRIDEHILHYIAGIAGLHETLVEIAKIVNADEQLSASQLVVAEKITASIQNSLGNKTPYTIFLNGGNHTDKTVMAAAAASGQGLQLLMIVASLLPQGQHELNELVRLWNREALLNGYLLYINATEFDKADKQRLQQLRAFIENINGPVIIETDGWMPELNRKRILLDIEKPAAAEQKAIWKQQLGSIHLTEEALYRIISQFNLDAATIRKATADLQITLSFNANSNDAGYNEAALWKICCIHTRPQIEELAQRIQPVASWSDIVLPSHQIVMLKELANQVKQRNKVYDDWGFAKKGERGLGISALFAGESGTGKTMAAEVLANELQLDLYRIDLSKVVNKYIGETEKNLKRIFDAAEEGGAILLFDEADALFGKRSDVKDSHDRYSNIEVSYLLQRMEAYRGLAILTTNMKGALDKAFLRRIRFVVQFPFPDLAQREAIWHKIFPGSTPLKELDMERLAKMAIPGGNIRNIALNAAFLAANNNAAIEMQHIVRSARLEYEKIERPFINI